MKSRKLPVIISDILSYFSCLFEDIQFCSAPPPSAGDLEKHLQSSAEREIYNCVWSVLFKDILTLSVKRMKMPPTIIMEAAGPTKEVSNASAAAFNWFS